MEVLARAVVGGDIEVGAGHGMQRAALHVALCSGNVSAVPQLTFDFWQLGGFDLVDAYIELCSGSQPVHQAGLQRCEAVLAALAPAARTVRADVLTAVCCALTSADDDLFADDDDEDA